MEFTHWDNATEKIFLFLKIVTKINLFQNGTKTRPNRTQKQFLNIRRRQDKSKSNFFRNRIINAKKFQKT